MAGEDEIIAAIEAAEDAGPPEDRPVSALDRTCAFLLRNDIGNADRLIARYGADLAFHPALGWLAWDGRRWDAELGPLVAQQKAQATARAMFVEARCFPEPDRDKAIEEGVQRGLSGKPLDKFVEGVFARHAALVEAHLRFAKSSGNQGKIVAMLDAAAPHLTRRPEAFDARPFIFNATDRALHLRPDGTVAARPHGRGDLLTLLGGAAYEPAAACPRFTAFLARIQPDAAMRAYLQRLAGYLLTGDISEQVFCVFHGGGRNGKGTLMNAWRGVLGEYAVTARIETLGENRNRSGSEANPDIARMRGRRFIPTGDAPDHFTIDAGMVKQATGQEPITARQLNKGFFEFLMQGKFVVPCNPKPRIPGQDDGIWRRIHLVPFEVQIPSGEIDPGLGAALAGEASGILNWMLEGYAAWRREGLNPPEAVKAATADYRHESDPLGEFLETWTDARPGARAKAKALFEAYGAFCKDNGYPEPKSGVSFGKALKGRGLGSMKSDGVKVWIGLALRETARDDARATAEKAAELDEIRRANRAAWEADQRRRGLPVDGPGDGADAGVSAGPRTPLNEGGRDREGGGEHAPSPGRFDEARWRGDDDPFGTDYD